MLVSPPDATACGRCQVAKSQIPREQRAVWCACKPGWRGAGWGQNHRGPGLLVPGEGAAGVQRAWEGVGVSSGLWRGHSEEAALTPSAAPTDQSPTHQGQCAWNTAWSPGGQQTPSSPKHGRAWLCSPAGSSSFLRMFSRGRPLVGTSLHSPESSKLGAQCQGRHGAWLQATHPPNTGPSGAQRPRARLSTP